MATHLSDEEQAERLKRWIRTYGGTALTAVLVVLIAYFGMSYWQKTQQAKQFIVAGQYQKLTEASAAALQNPEDQARQTEFLAAADQLIKDSPDSGYAFHSLLLQAKLAVEQQDYAAAEQALIKATTHPVKDAGLIQLAQLRLARVQAQLDQIDNAMATLAKVTDPAFLPSANELKGDLLVKKNQRDEAKQAYQAAWDALIAREEPRELLRIKMESLGMTIADVELPSPIRERGVTS